MPLVKSLQGLLKTDPSKPASVSVHTQSLMTKAESFPWIRKLVCSLRTSPKDSRHCGVPRGSRAIGSLFIYKKVLTSSHAESSIYNIKRSVSRDAPAVQGGLVFHCRLHRIWRNCFKASHLCYTYLSTALLM